MKSEAEIRESIKEEMARLNDALSDSLKSDNSLLKSVTDYFLEAKGKQIRPMLVILSSKLFGQISRATLDAAVAVELLHSASLIHDDVVDESPARRGRRSVNSIWDNRVSVLVGDYFVSCALKAAIATGDTSIINIIAELGKELARGEIDQIETADSHTIDEERYFNVINQKTASLFSSCMKMGAISNGASEREVEILSTFGEKLGLCFQIKDDIFDYFTNEKLGKPTGSDLAEGKVSLPLIYAIRTGNDRENSDMRALLSKERLTQGEIATLIEYAKKMGGIEYAEETMKRLEAEAIAELAPFGKNEITDSLINILHYITVRNY
ncbi:MAG: polyprenyl synthetase family protein [Bacteroidetes bacterium]|uniref:Polyprenyl synthetase family protein n=1 Tax=Candidatus Caccoplasma merdipullorum TaxID=2840718 RepID=A0A9D9H4E3_9BACT|nr:polyprenyl synthetase family protein [Candidatus Caccoplasma merdipullorum]